MAGGGAILKPCGVARGTRGHNAIFQLPGGAKSSLAVRPIICRLQVDHFAKTLRKIYSLTLRTGSKAFPRAMGAKDYERFSGRCFPIKGLDK